MFVYSFHLTKNIKFIFFLTLKKQEKKKPLLPSEIPIFIPKWLVNHNIGNKMQIGTSEGETRKSGKENDIERWVFYVAITLTTLVHLKSF